MKRVLMIFMACFWMLLTTNAQSGLNIEPLLRELVKMGLKTLLQTLSECMRPYEDFPLEYCEYCKYNNHDPSVGIFNHCTRGDY